MVQIKVYFGLIVAALLISCNDVEDSIRLVPQGYQGPVMIIYDQQDGVGKEYENDKRILRIPQNGILETQFEANFDSRQALTFYYITEED